WLPPTPIMLPLRYLAAGLIPIALLTLGVQLNRVRLDRHFALLGVIVLNRLIIAPLMAWMMTWFLAFEGTEAAVLIALAGAPVAVNVFILSKEYEREPELASQAVFITTLLCVITQTVWLTLLKAN
ncbi:MAG: AEC family transporter, partial [Lentisphaerae bacterium]